MQLPCLEGTGADYGVFAGMELWEAPRPWFFPALRCFPTLNYENKVLHNRGGVQPLV